MRQTMVNDPTRLLPDDVVFQDVMFQRSVIPTPGIVSCSTAVVALRLPDVETSPCNVPLADPSVTVPVTASWLCVNDSVIGRLVPELNPLPEQNPTMLPSSPQLEAT